MVKHPGARERTERGENDKQSEEPGRDSPRQKPAAAHRAWSRLTDWHDLLPVALLTLVGLLLRVSSMETRGYWLDEATTWKQTTMAISVMLAKMSRNVHPPLFHLSMHYWIGVFGSSEVAMRGFSLVLGTAAIPLAFRAGRAIYDRRTGLIAAILVSVSPFLIWQSQEARMYSMMFLLAMLSTTYCWLAFRESRVADWVGYGVFTLMGLLTQYFFLFLFVSQAAYFALYRLMPNLRAWRRDRATGPRPAVRARGTVPPVEAWLITCLIVTLLFSIWFVPVLFKPVVKSHIAQPLNYGWAPPRLNPQFNSTVQVLVEMAWGYHSVQTTSGLVAMWPALLYLAIVLLSLAGPVTDRTRFLILTGAGSAVVILLLGQWQPILASRYFMAVSVPLMILIARLVAVMRPKPGATMVVLLVILMLAAWTDQSFNPRNRLRWDNREALGVVKRDFRQGDVILVVPWFISPLVQYYLPPRVLRHAQGFPKFDAGGRPKNTYLQLDKDLRRIVGNAPRVWMVLSWQDTRQVYEDGFNIRWWLRSQRYGLRRDRRLRQVRLLLFTRRPAGGQPLAPGEPSR